DSKVLVVGAGGLGSPSSIYLAAAGVGTIGIIDADRVDLSNLHRQVLHFNRDVNRPKTQSAKEHLEALNPDVLVIEHPVYLDSSNALEIIRDYDLVINGCDNFATRYLVNDACVLLKKPLIDASILRFEGQATVFLPGQGCYRCLYPEPPPPGMVPNCAQAGIIGALAGHMGTPLVINGCDNFATRYLVNDACVLLKKPLIDASILRFEGQATVFLPGQGCYRCLYPEPPPPGMVPNCAQAGIIGALAGHMGTLQVI